jgi:hypothetical protein
MIEDYPYAKIDFSRDPDMGIPPEVVRGELDNISFQIYLIFLCCFYIYHFFCIPECLACMYFLCAYVGPVHPTDCFRNRRRPRPKDGVIGATGPAGAVDGPPTDEAERVLRWVERNLTALTRAVPMVEIEDMPPSMQPHVVGAP